MKIICNRPENEHGSTIQDALIGKLGYRDFGKLRDGMVAATRKSRKRRSS